MAFRFRKSKKLFPGVTASLGKKGFGVRIGGRNVGMSFGPSGKRVTSSIPGTGLSFSQRLGGGRQDVDEPTNPKPSRSWSMWTWIVITSALIAFFVVIFSK